MRPALGRTESSRAERAEVTPLVFVEIEVDEGLTENCDRGAVALDQSAGMVEIAPARMPHARVLQGDVAPLPFAPARFVEPS